MDEYPLSTRLGDREAVALLNRLRAATARAERLEAKLAAVEQALRDYYFAMDEHWHAETSERAVIDDIEKALGMWWVEGAEAARRKGAAS